MKLLGPFLFADIRNYVNYLNDARPPGIVTIAPPTVLHDSCARLQTFTYRQNYALVFHLDPVWEESKTALGSVLAAEMNSSEHPYPFQIRLRTTASLATPQDGMKDVIQLSSTKVDPVMTAGMYTQRMYDMFARTRSKLSDTSDPAILWHLTFYLDIYEQLYELNTVPVE